MLFLLTTELLIKIQRNRLFGHGVALDGEGKHTMDEMSGYQPAQPTGSHMVL